ncbi:MAG: FAD-binding oxidoreductase [Alphaproteobacteria bacterium]|nr:FAD-binding oxidoreductase [Alphaproteobacteria bacterium]
MRSADVIVVGGGLFGSAIGYGLAQDGQQAVVLDEGDGALRAARGNFGLVWVQSKGLGVQRYQEWSRESADLFPDFADELRDLTGIDVAYRGGGGVDLLLGEAELEERKRYIAQMQQQAGAIRYEGEIIDRVEVQKMLPDIRLGPDLIGASYSPHDGDVNPLLLLRALHAAIPRVGGRYLTEHRVESIDHNGSAFVAQTTQGPIAAPKIVLAAGHGAPRLGPMVGLSVPIVPQRGQVLITERVRARFPMPMGSIRQTNEGTMQLGNSKEDVEFDSGTTTEVTRRIASRAVRCFPQLASVRLVRTWGCIRVLTPDGAAIYDESESNPGAYVATSHSGVTLAAVNARHVARWIAGGQKQPGFEEFSARRFDVQAAA